MRFESRKNVAVVMTLLVMVAHFAWGGLRRDSNVMRKMGPQPIAASITGLMVDLIQRSADIEEPDKLNIQSGLILTALDQALAKLKIKHFSPSLIAFDEKHAAFQNGKLSAAEYAVYLDSIELATTHQIRDLIAAVYLQESINYPQLEREQKFILKKLNENLPPEQLAHVYEKGILVQSGQVKFGDYMALLEEKAKKCGFDFSEFMEIKLYAQYMTKAGSLEVNTLYQEIALLERNVKKKLIQNAAQQELVFMSDDFYQLKRSTHEALKEKDWPTYQLNRDQVAQLGNRLILLGGNKLGPEWSRLKSSR